MEVRHITKKIADLNERLDATSVLAEPRENAFIKYQWEHQMHDLIPAFKEFGKVLIGHSLTFSVKLYRLQVMFPSFEINGTVIFDDCHDTLRLNTLPHNWVAFSLRLMLNGWVTPK